MVGVHTLASNMLLASLGALTCLYPSRVWVYDVYTNLDLGDAIISGIQIGPNLAWLRLAWPNLAQALCCVLRSVLSCACLVLSL